jgi:hypothetical protein
VEPREEQVVPVVLLVEAEETREGIPEGRPEEIREGVEEQEGIREDSDIYVTLPDGL